MSLTLLTREREIELNKIGKQRKWVLIGIEYFIPKRMLSIQAAGGLLKPHNKIIWEPWVTLISTIYPFLFAEDNKHNIPKGPVIMLSIYVFLDGFFDFRPY